jgi:hypothetical protein
VTPRWLVLAVSLAGGKLERTDWLTGSSPLFDQLQGEAQERLAHGELLCSALSRLLVELIFSPLLSPQYYKASSHLFSPFAQDEQLTCFTHTNRPRWRS